MDDIRDIKGPIRLTTRPDWLGQAAVAAALVLFGLAVWRWRRRAAPWRPLRRSWAVLAREAEILGDRAFYYRLAALADAALSRRLGFDAGAMTSAEVLARPELAALPPEWRPALADLFRRADAARYGEALFPEQEKTADLATVRRLLGTGLP